MSNTNEQQANSPQPGHQVIADGIVIYSGPDWQQAFLAAGMNPTYGAIEHRANGEQGAVMGPYQPSRYTPHL